MRKRPKKTVAQQLKQVRSLIPRQSKKTFRDFNTVVLLQGAFNRNTVHEISCFDKTILASYAANLTKVDAATVADYTAENVKLTYSLYFKFMMKNAVTANSKISYAFVRCKDDDDESPLECILEELVDRGYTGLPSIDSYVAATATASIKPTKLAFREGNHHVPVFSGAALRRNWKFLTPVTTATLGPGDTLDIVWSDPKFIYDQEYIDQENGFSHIKGQDVKLLIAVQGDLAHDATNHHKVCRSDAQYDCEQQRQCTVTYPNPKGLNEVAYTDDLTTTGVTTPNHVDNTASAVETDGK